MTIKHDDLIQAGDERSGAVFSSCRHYRYHLWRRWAPGPSVLWIMLNPSTADELTLDPTVTRCRNFSRTWGFPAFEVVNLFAWRATDPADLFRAHEPVGPANDSAILEAADRAGLIVLAWGNHGLKRGRATEVLSLLAGQGRALHYLRSTRGGQPAHPLYLPRDVTPIAFVGNEHD